jgi:hypothetical protein
MDFMSPMSFLRLTISNDTVLDTTTAPRISTNANVVQMNASYRTPSGELSPREVTADVTSKSVFAKRNRKLVNATTVVIESRTIVDLKGRRFKSVDA